MVRNKKGGNKGKKIARKHSTQTVQRGLRLSKDKCAIYAGVERVDGQGMCNGICNDGVERLCIIRRKFKGRGKRDNFVGPGAWLLVGIREWEIVNPKKKPKCDLLEVYNNMEKDRLRKTKIDFSHLLNNDSTINSDEEDTSVEFVDSNTMKYENLIQNTKDDNKKLSTIGDMDEINIDDI